MSQEITILLLTISLGLALATILVLVVAILRRNRDLDTDEEFPHLGEPVRYTMKAYLQANVPVQPGTMLVANADGTVAPAPTMVGVALEDSEVDGRVLVGVLA